uniref:Uncharacterized protein n=1 Tax=viral metagenome TaxID=1070528 RepID=A0A6M3IZY7_9ZZZZ
MRKYFILFASLLIIAGTVFAGSQQTSSTLASTIITNARYYLNETTASFWTDAELLIWVNAGTKDIVSRTRCLESSESISLLANTTEYTITGPYIDISTVVYNDINGVKKGLVRKNPQSIGHSTDIDPTWWYEWNGKLGIFPPLDLVPDAGLAIGTTLTSVSSKEFNYKIKGKVYTKAAVAAGTTPGNDVIPTGKYGAVSFDIGSDGTIDAVEAYYNIVGYTTAALAASGLSQVADGHVRMGYVTASKSDGAFTFGTTALNAANTTVVYTDSAPTATVYFVETPSVVTSAQAILVPSSYDNALTLYVAAKAFLKSKQYAKSARFMAEYYAEIDRFRGDFVERPKESESNVTR